MVPTELVATRNRKLKAVLYLKQAAVCRRRAATETNAELKAELLLYAAELEAKAREQRKPYALRRVGERFQSQNAQPCRDLASSNDTELLRFAEAFELRARS